MQICSKRTVRQMEEFAIFVKFVNFGCHNNYFRPGPRLLYATCSFKLPQRACASYMRKDEMKTISNAHKATVLSHHTSGFRINTDGTTKQQKKLGGVAINDMVVSVNELSDGTSATAISDVSRELEMLRETAHALKLPNADSINWTLIVSSTSDSASTQKRFNKLIEECRESDELRFGPATLETIDLVETFCSMHLGINLRKAFLGGIVNEANAHDHDRKYHPVDTLVYEFCKLFGKHGSPEYGCGVLQFSDFLSLMSVDPTISEEDREYYHACGNVTLERQIGSRYFVTASNASKVLFLKDAALEFLKFTGKDTGNKLERDLYNKLLDHNEISQLRVDGLMYYHVYADLVMLSKSCDLAKSAFDMNQHYLELQMYLQEIEHHPDIVLERNHHVFVSEKALHGDNPKLNHRHHSKSYVYKRVFETDCESVFPLLTSGARKMREKLQKYAQIQLPGGIYWDPEPKVKAILTELKPSNDLCESILGLNDYLTTAIPNLHQMARSNLVEVKKKKTLQWLNDLPDEQQLEIISLAVDKRKNVRQRYKDLEEQRTQKRKQGMLHAKILREALKKKSQLERDELSELHLITTSEELRQTLKIIEAESTSAAKRKASKLSLLKSQVKLRKKVLKQDINIVFTRSRQPRPTEDIVKELSDYIDQNSKIPNPCELIGKHILHKFRMEESETGTRWYHGTVLAYNAAMKKHEITYEGEEGTCHFDLTIDLLAGDLKVINL